MQKAKCTTLNAITFIELLLVIIIIGILIGVSIPSFRKTSNRLQLENSARQLQTVMNYLHQRSIIEQKIILLNIDNEKKEYWAQIKDTSTPLKTYPIPSDIFIEIIKKSDTDNKQILFYPDGQIDKITIKLTNREKETISLTTEGVYGGVKMVSQE